MISISIVQPLLFWSWLCKRRSLNYFVTEFFWLVTQMQSVLSTYTSKNERNPFIGKHENNWHWPFSGQSVRYSLCYQLIQMKIRVTHHSMEKHENNWRWLSWYFFVLISRLQGISGVVNRTTIWEFGCLAFGQHPLKASTCLEKSLLL